MGIELLRKARFLRRSKLLRLMNLWPPFMGAGIRVQRISDDFREVDVELVFGRFNRNYVGTQFGGSLYAMVDPFYMLMLMENLGPQYIVWDKAATIRFKKPGKGPVRASFRLTEAQIEAVRQAAKPKMDAEFQVSILDESGTLIAEVDKTIYVRKRDA